MLSVKLSFHRLVGGNPEQLKLKLDTNEYCPTNILFSRIKGSGLLGRGNYLFSFKHVLSQAFYEVESVLLLFGT
mgnify:CR=1 FL=1